MNAHYDQDGLLRTARHEGRVAGYSRKPIGACPYAPPSAITAKSWLQGHQEAQS